MHIQKNVPLGHLNTFGLPANAAFFAEANSTGTLAALLTSAEWKGCSKLILGGGSNMLLLGDVDALVIRMTISGIEQVRQDEEHVWLRVGGGVVWHDFVMYCVENGYAGVENLSLIPGTVGAAPMQNIGAYGMEVRQIVEEVEAISRKDGSIRTFSNAECQFGYRESVFKHALKDQYVITGATFKLSKKPSFHTDYGDIRNTLTEMGVQELTLRAVSDAVISIRRSKLPDPAEIGNAGSFFKNPEISKTQYQELVKLFPGIPGYETSPDSVKVPAGWLIDQAGWKGYRDGDVGVHSRQALVLVNFGNGTGKQIKALSEKIQASIQERYGIRLQAEVNFI